MRSLSLRLDLRKPIMVLNLCTLNGEGEKRGERKRGKDLKEREREGGGERMEIKRERAGGGGGRESGD